MVRTLPLHLNNISHLLNRIETDPSPSDSSFGLPKLDLEVTYDPAIVGLRFILESMTVSNPQLSISLSKEKVDFLSSSLRHV
jgi:hypothetical protein